MPFRRTASWTARIAAAAVVLVILVALATLTGRSVSAGRADARAQALLAAGKAPAPRFDAGDIISDDAFYNADAMTAEGIRQWLLAMPCTPRDQSPCLAFFRQDTTTRPANRNCHEYRGGKDETAARIVAQVAHACGISPRVLLVLVQKEQSLVTRPSQYGYERATGYGCPDTAACEQKYFGFFNQLYSAAWQFREYDNPADGWKVRPGRVSVRFSPDASCGASVVDIANQATANLYLYTPYQPDAAALAHPGANGGKCSAYGNLNFFQLYNTWFGDSRAVRYPAWWGPCLNNVDGVACRPRN